MRLRFAVAMLALAAPVVPVAAAQRAAPPPPSCSAPADSDLPAVRAGRRSLAVLAFDTPSGDQARHDLATALGSRVSRRLSALRPRDVIARPGRTGASGSGLNRRAGVEARYLLAATLEPDRPGVSLYVRLLDGSTGREIWRGRFARARERLHELEGAIASAVAARTLSDLTNEEVREISAPPTRNPAAYARFLAGLQASARRGRPSARSAIESYDAAWRADPAFIDAWIHLAAAYSRFLDTDGIAARDADAMVVAALTATDRALALDAGRSEAWVVRADLLQRRNPRAASAIREAYERALAVDPDDWEAHRRLGALLAYVGEHERAATHFRSALFLEPEYPGALTDFAEMRLTQGRYGEACALLNAALEANPSGIDAYILRVLARIPLREFRAAWGDAETAVRLGSPTQGEAVSVLVDVAAEDVTGARARARQLAERPMVRSQRALSVREAQLLAFAFVAVGERALALQALQRAQPRGARLWSVLQHARLQPLRGTTAYQVLLTATSPFEDQP